MHKHICISKNNNDKYYPSFVKLFVPDSMLNYVHVFSPYKGRLVLG